MDLSQNKLSKREWETIEKPVSEQEKKILDMIIKGYDDVNIHTNDTKSMYSFVKIEQTPGTEFFLYKKYFEPTIQPIITKYGKGTPIASFTATSKLSGKEIKPLKSADTIRIQNLENTIDLNKQHIFEFILLDLAKELLKQIIKRKQKYAFYLYTILHLKKSTINYLNQYVVSFIDACVNHANSFTKTSEIITNAYEFIEKNPYLLKYEDRTLFSHQKELFTICKQNVAGNFLPKLVLYTAPTGTGKTLSPIGLSNKNRIIFVCVARHIGLALAKAAISMEKKVAFAFGCQTASDIRLHYFSAVDFTKNYKSGGIWKVNNEVGDNVEIMICDVKSYLVSMHYMLAFNPAESIITYWDEPTITLDYEEHELHAIIHENWKQNKIPTVVLSCATLPSMEEIRPVFDDFRCKFDNAEMHTITSFDCKKSIPILNKDSYCVLPHYMYSDYNELRKCAEYCKSNKTLLRYFDLREIIAFVEHVNSAGYIDSTYMIDSYFTKITDVTMNSLKEYYLTLLLQIDSANWDIIHKYVVSNRKQKYKQNTTIRKYNSLQQSVQKTGEKLSRTVSVAIPIQPEDTSMHSPTPGLLLTTSDAYTLTDGPTIFLVDDVKKIANFLVQQSNIAPSVLEAIMDKIESNSNILKKINTLEANISAKEEKTSSDNPDRKVSLRESGRLCKESQAWMNDINKLREDIRMVSIDPMYVPNTRPHQEIWSPLGEPQDNSYVSRIGDNISKKIMLLDIDTELKTLLLLGIGMFVENLDTQYMEIMKQLAEEQRLFIIIASTDYIYGTNYQFCHGFIGKDLTKMTQQKTLQAMGRIGRNHVQQDYTIRFRDDDMIEQLFQKQEVNMEATNMCRLFCSE